MIEMLTGQNYLVCDPFLVSNNTRNMFERLEHRWIGTETFKKYALEFQKSFSESKILFSYFMDNI